MSKMLQEQHEQSVGDRFASWLSSKTGEQCIFKRRGRPKLEPDLMYEFRLEELGVEVTDAYYDDDHAKLLWKAARGEPDAKDSWVGVDSDKSLAAAILERVAQKSKKTYAERAVLLIGVPPGVTSAEELERLLASRTALHTPFVGVYVVGRFPITTTSVGGYRVLPLKAMSQS